MAAEARKTVRFAEYLMAERASDAKHQYVRGQIFAMAGGTPEHGRLAANVIRELGLGLGDRPCVVFTSDVRVRVVEAGRGTYPDVSVVCGAVQNAPDDEDAITNPVVLVEVLSDSTEADDRGDKFADYRRLPSLREYVLVAQRAPRIEVFRRETDGWKLHEFGPGQAARLASLDVDLQVDRVYRNPLA